MVVFVWVLGGGGGGGGEGGGGGGGAGMWWGRGKAATKGRLVGAATPGRGTGRPRDAPSPAIDARLRTGRRPLCLKLDPRCHKRLPADPRRL